MFRPLLLQRNKIFCISLHFSGKQCSTSSLTFDDRQLQVWKNITFNLKETTAKGAILADSWPYNKPIYARLQLKREVKTLCSENFLIIGYTKVSEFILDPKHRKATFIL
jgi:hypothetical protein